MTQTGTILCLKWLCDVRYIYIYILINQYSSHWVIIHCKIHCNATPFHPPGMCWQVFFAAISADVNPPHPPAMETPVGPIETGATHQGSWVNWFPSQRPKGHAVRYQPPADVLKERRFPKYVRAKHWRRTALFEVELEHNVFNWRWKLAKERFFVRSSYQKKFRSKAFNSPPTNAIFVFGFASPHSQFVTAHGTGGGLNVDCRGCATLWVSASPTARQVL